VKNRLASPFVLAVVALLSIPVATLAQATAKPAAPTNPITTSVKVVYDSVSDDFLAGAQKMPEENYSFKPTPDVRSFGQIVGHVADVNFMLCAFAISETVPSKDFENTKTSKADLLAALKESVAYCNKVYDRMTDAKAAEMIKYIDSDLARIGVLSVNTAHTDEHYGNLVTYLRLKGLVPPTSASQQAPPAK
jgi:DinB superfamily